MNGLALPFPNHLWESVRPRYCAEAWWDAGMRLQPKVYAVLDKDAFIRHQIYGVPSPWKLRVWPTDDEGVIQWGVM